MGAASSPDPVLGAPPVARRRPRRIGERTLARWIAIYAAALLLLAWVLVPFGWMILSSLLPERAITSRPPTIPLDSLSLDSYRAILGNAAFVRALVNSVIVAGASTIACLALGSCAAFPLSRLRVRASRLVLLALISARMVPALVLLIPLFFVMRDLKLLDTHVGLIIVYTAFLLPFATWMLFNFYSDIPRSLEAAARVDGCSRVGAFVRVVIPLAFPGVAATGIFVFISAWNEFLLPLVLTDVDAQVVTVQVVSLTGRAQGGFSFSEVMAAGVITALPALVLVALMQRRIVHGIVQGGTRG